MGLLSNIAAKAALKAFQKIGYALDHQTGSHMILFHSQRNAKLFLRNEASRG